MNLNSTHCFFIAASWNDAPVSRHFRALAEALVARGHQVVLLVDGQQHQVENPQGQPAILTWPSRRPVKVQDARLLWRLIRQYRPACLIANYGACNVMLLVGWLLGVPCRVGWYHTVSDAIDLDAHGASWWMRLLRWRKRLVYHAATHLVPASRAGLADLLRVFAVNAEKCRVFYNSLADPVTVDAPLATANKPCQIVCIGRLYPTKGQDVLLRAMALLKDRLPQVRVEFVGGGPEAQALQALAEQLGVALMCDFTGAVNHAGVLARLQTATLTVVPSRSDNHPLVVIEALALGIPVIASQVGGIVESLSDGVEGFLVPPDDPAALAEKLLTLLTDSALRQRMSQQARARFLRQFEQQQVLAEQVQWFETLVSPANAWPRFATPAPSRNASIQPYE